MQDSAAGLDGGDAGQGAGQDAGATRINGLMSTLGKRTSERDEAIAERDRLREQLAREMAGPEPDEPPAPSTEVDDTAQAATADDDASTEVEDVDVIPEPGPDGYIRTEDGGVFRASAMPANGMAPTSPPRAPLPKGPQPGSLAELRGRFAAELPAYAEEIADRSLLGQR